MPFLGLKRENKFMSVINKISAPSLEPLVKNQKVAKESSVENNFESQLLEMVEKVETMNTEIEAMIESNGTENPVTVKHGVHRVGTYINNVAGLVENFSSQNSSEKKGVKSANNPYGRLSSTKDS